MANVSLRDISEFLELSGELRIQPEVTEYALEDADRALVLLRSGGYQGGKGTEDDLNSCPCTPAGAAECSCILFPAF
ncbi:MAG: hypothetical protein AVO35_11085 [Candidatus Aegiribacteria sp. MLS_C]|nr:MAG: hypothetical protein AVO35_11085 [Candidatus Aegiribacteria sp. MLS_C]